MIVGNHLEDFEPILVLVFFINSYLILRYCPLDPAEPPEATMLPPTHVLFEKTDDVSENIRRYKEAQRNAIIKIQHNQSKQ